MDESFELDGDHYPTVVLDLVLAAQQAFATGRKIVAGSNGEEALEKLRAHFRVMWHRGRVVHWLETSQAAAAPRTEIAELLLVSVPSVSNWFLGKRGVEAHHFEILKRHYEPKGLATKPNWESELDCAGYRCCATDCRRQISDDANGTMSVLEFWTLWQLLRSEAWLLAYRSKNHERLMRTEAVLRRTVEHALESMNHDRFAGTDLAWHEHCRMTLEKWTVAWVLTVDSLDIKCWTPLHAAKTRTTVGTAR